MTTAAAAKLDEGGEDRLIEEIRRSVTRHCAEATAGARDGILLWRGQQEGGGMVRSVLPTTAYGTRQAASAYAMASNDPSLEPALPSAFVMPAVLGPRSVFACSAVEDHDPFIDLDTVLACFGREVAEHLAQACAGTIRQTSAFEELAQLSGIGDPLEMVRAWPARLDYLPPVLMHEALRETTFVEALRKLGHDAVRTGGCGVNAMEPEWHVLDPAIAGHGFAPLRDHLRPGVALEVTDDLADELEAGP